MNPNRIFIGPPPSEPHPIIPTRLDDPRVQEHLSNLQMIFSMIHPEAQFKPLETIEPVAGVCLRVYLADEEVDVPKEVDEYLFQLLDREGLFVYLNLLPLRWAPLEAA